MRPTSSAHSLSPKSKHMARKSDYHLSSQRFGGLFSPSNQYSAGLNTLGDGSRFINSRRIVSPFYRGASGDVKKLGNQPTTASKRNFSTNRSIASPHLMLSKGGMQEEYKCFKKQNDDVQIDNSFIGDQTISTIRMKMSLCKSPVLIKLMVIDSERKGCQFLQVYESTQIFMIKFMIQKKCRIPIEIQVLSYKKHSIDNIQTVFDVMRGVIQTPQFKSRNSFHFQPAKCLNASYNDNIASNHNFASNNNKSFTSGISNHRPILQLTLTVIKRIGGSKFKIGIDLTFNAIKHVRKIPFKQQAPIYRDVDDGLCWCCYCMNPRCKIYKELFIVKKGYGKFNLHREYDFREIKCPVCRSLKIQVRNCGFVKCQWQIRSCYKQGNMQSFSGKTYDHSLHTLKQSNLIDVWKFFQIQITKLPRQQLLSASRKHQRNKKQKKVFDELDKFNIYNLPSNSGENIQQAQTVGRKLFKQSMMPPKIHSISPSPQPEEFYIQQSRNRAIGGFGIASNNIFTGKGRFAKPF